MRVCVAVACIVGIALVYLFASRKVSYGSQGCFLADHLRNARTGPAILFYFFPQWHSMPENNREHDWDFTDWDLIKQMKKDVPDSKTIQLPTELGWYNLLSHDIRKRQADLLQQYGGYGFIYHVYWFSDHPVMDEPMRQMLADKDIAVPFMVSWANEHWVARWAGGDGHEILRVNVSSSDNRRKFFQYLLPYFRDNRYIRIQGKPVFQVYQANDDMDLVFKDFKRWAIEANLTGLHCHQVLAHFHGAVFSPSSPESFHVPVSALADGVTEFQPNLIKQWTSTYFTSTARIKRHHRSYHWRGLHVDWDDGPRKRTYRSTRSHPYFFEIQLQAVMEAMQEDIKVHSLVAEDQYVAINAWNEWSEGNTMEPSTVYGRGYLEAMEIVTKKRPSSSKICMLMSTSGVEESFQYLSVTINSVHQRLLEVNWEILIYSAHETTGKPLSILNFVRNTNEPRIRFIDVPYGLQQTNTSGFDILTYILPHCHSISKSHYVIFLRVGDQLQQSPQPPVNWASTWHFFIRDCFSKGHNRTAERTTLLEVNQDLARTFSLQSVPFLECPVVTLEKRG